MAGGEGKKKNKTSSDVEACPRHMQLAVFEDSVILHVATLGDWQVTTAARLVKVSADLLSIASNRLSLRMFFLKSLFHFNLKNGWNIRFYWWKSCTWGFAFNHVFNGNKSAATWLLFLVVLISYGLVTPCKLKNNNNFVKSGGCPWNMPFFRKLLFSLGVAGEHLTGKLSACLGLIFAFSQFGSGSTSIYSLWPLPPHLPLSNGK